MARTVPSAGTGGRRGAACKRYGGTVGSMSSPSPSERGQGAQSSRGALAGGVLVAGGYGDVGARVTRMLRDAGWQVTVAGRDGGRARAAAERLGASAQRLDVDDEASVAAALDGVAAVVCCVDRRSTHLIDQAVGAGLAFVDVSAGEDIVRAADRYRPLAEGTGARVLAGCGLQPGLANVAVARACEQVGQPSGVRTGLLLSLGDDFGPAALDWVVRSAATRAPVLADGRWRHRATLRRYGRMDFGPGHGMRVALGFPFPDRLGYGDSFGVVAADSHLALSPRWAHRVLVVAGATGATTLARWGPVRMVAGDVVERLAHASAHAQGGEDGENGFSLVAEAWSRNHRATVRLTGHGQSAATAVAVTLALPRLLDRPPGVWRAEQVMATSILADLKTRWNIGVHEEVVDR